MLQWEKSEDDKESACTVGDADSFPMSGRCPGEGSGTHPSILAWEAPWTEQPGGLQFLVSQKSRT